MGDSATDSEPPSGAALVVALGRGNEAGLLAVHDAYGPDLLGYADFLLDGRTEPAGDGTDAAAAAVRDALLVATGAIGDLTDPDRMLPWLLALTRNECLRRGAVAVRGAEAEAAELGRRGLRSLEVAALLGFTPAELPRPVPPERTPPAWLRAELVAAAGPEGVSRRAELTRRARPFEPDGFPVPLDRRRLSGKVLAWSAAAVVVIALGLLVGLPTNGSAGSAAVTSAALAEAATPTGSAPPVEATDDPIPTLGQTSFGAVAGDPAAVPAETDAGAQTPPAAGATPTPQVRTDAGAGRRSRTSGSLELIWTPAAGVSCGDPWTAHLHVTTGGVEVAGVVATAARVGATVALQPDGDGWSGDLTGLPTDRTVTVTAVADAAVRAASARLHVDC